jgi:hypothetical protein
MTTSNDPTNNEKALLSALIAVEAVSMMLARWVARQDPAFTGEARAKLDELLGLMHTLGSYLAPLMKDSPMMKDVPVLKEILVSSRQTFQSIMTDADRAMPPATPPRPKTWRRRLFEWLERG